MTERGAGPPARKGYRNGTHRLVPPAATLARVRPLMRVLGITRIANVTGLDRLGIPVVMVARPNARSVAVSQGKGLDLDAAKASGLMEAVETWHGETFCPPLKYASFDALRWSHRMIDIAGLPRPVDSGFDENRPILWIEGRELLDGSPVWLPWELVHTDYTLPTAPGAGCFAANTNGLASGNHPLEAILHALCEVIERDATSLWHSAGAAARQAALVDPDSVDDPACRWVLERFAAARVAVRIWNTTTDVGVACFLCLAVGEDPTSADPEFGAGCHPAREVALLRALTEAAQARTTYIAGARDDMGWDVYAPAASRERTQACTALLAGAPAQRFADVPTWQAETIDEDVAETLHRLSAAGVRQVALVDLTHARLQVPVVRVVVPGLEGAPEAGGGACLPGVRARRVMEAGG